MGHPREPAQLDAEFGVNAAWVRQAYEDFQNRPDSVGEEWQRFFDAGPKAEAPAVRELRGAAAKIAENMRESLGVPTATSIRTVPAKVLEENRDLINEHRAAENRGKISFTHLIAWALVRAAEGTPAMLRTLVLVDGKPHEKRHDSVRLGIATDVRRGGSRTLVVPGLDRADALDFAQFVAACDAVLAKAREGRLAPADVAGALCTLTNPGTLGTTGSVPRLMAGQAFILAAGAIALPAEYAGASESLLAELAVGRVLTLTCTYDHRVIQGAESGEFLGLLSALLSGEHGFYERIFADLGVPHAPFVGSRDSRSAPGSPQRAAEQMLRAARVMTLIRAYRARGYLLADLDPLLSTRRRVEELELSTHGLSIWDLDREFSSHGTTPQEVAPLREILAVLRATYTRHVAVEYFHITDPEQREWLRARMEATRNEAPLDRRQMLDVLDRLVQAESFERFLHTRFVGHKRFSLEGGESLIPALDAILAAAAESGIEQAVLGMAHRGRLNVLAHVLGKPLEAIFAEFEGHLDPEATQGSGDVKYHLGARGELEVAPGLKIAIELASNPSHLEAVDPVVEGIARALQDRAPAGALRGSVLALLVHGDAAFAGQGVVAETLNMSQLRGYRTGGTIHVVVDNQIGYTTPPSEARSTPHCTDLAKAIQAPIFHVNGDDPFAAVRMAKLAFDYRQRFARDVVLDIVCYRRHGHNEGDEPSFTQPLLYRRIEGHRSVREVCAERLVRAGVLSEAEANGYEEAVRQRLKDSLGAVQQREPHEPDASLAPTPVPEWDAPLSTAVPSARLAELAELLGALPSAFTAHPKVVALLERRVRMARGEVPVDFGCAETLAFAALLREGTPVRLSGQDSARGTFAQRHSALFDQATGERWVPLNHLGAGQARYVAVDSLLSEEAVLGFEYGYSVARPEALVIWEAQFGDFCNGAQVQIDQFIAAGEAKWGQASGLVLLLPHGYDGQGPEHSSARLERFLQLCAAGNMRVANPSTAAQYFHLLRRQALDPEKKPLVVMTPKSLLRLGQAASPVGALGEGAFAPVLEDPDVQVASARRVVLCSGKVFHDLALERQKGALGAGVALVRMELLYPWPAEALGSVLSARRPEAQLVWCQEEPANMGAFAHARAAVGEPIRYVGRPASASPASGLLHAHKAQQAEILRQALS